jgi:FAD/FMN-containing dehydrogenases
VVRRVGGGDIFVRSAVGYSCEFVFIRGSQFPMTAPMLNPTTSAELVDAVRSAPRVLAVGAGTKPRLSAVGDDVVRISTAKLRGILEYEPSEFTFTALAGTPVREIVVALAERGQYLPFDPMFADAGATIGGTVAAGISGPGRFRFGGLRDFILGVRFVDGEGRFLRMGGKVVKNAAGFDLPKFFVGSLGRFGVLAEVTFKVFPRPLVTRTLRIETVDAEAKRRFMTEAASARWEIDAMDTPVGEGAVFARLAGPPAALDALASDVLARWLGTVLSDADANEFWACARECRWAHAGGALVKVVLTPAQVAAFEVQVRAMAEARGWIGAGGNVGYVSLPAGVTLPELAWPAMTLRGAGALWPGAKPRFDVMARVKAALDPNHRFPGLDE